MIETIIASLIGSFMYDNIDFFKTMKEQKADGYEWTYNPKNHNPEVPAIAIENPVTKDKNVIWVLEK
ncbi:MAG: hypothetical protein CMH04_03935 [Marinovum sp.]|nr:hypothetical protein [Marinovum sp.]|tara:strand:+ start:39 stop:239 length:201 start_codon:yes stop_codon:yes gene_type:complete